MRIALEHNKHGQVRGFLKAFQKEELYSVGFRFWHGTQTMHIALATVLVSQDRYIGIGKISQFNHELNLCCQEHLFCSCMTHT